MKKVKKLNKKSLLLVTKITKSWQNLSTVVIYSTAQNAHSSLKQARFASVKASKGEIFMQFSYGILCSQTLTPSVAYTPLSLAKTNIMLYDPNGIIYS